MPNNKNKAVSTKASLALSSASLARCPRCGNGVDDLEKHTQQVKSTWTADQMHNDKDKMFICLDA